MSGERGGEVEAWGVILFHGEDNVKAGVDDMDTETDDDANDDDNGAGSAWRMWVSG